MSICYPGDGFGIDCPTYIHYRIHAPSPQCLRLSVDFCLPSVSDRPRVGSLSYGHEYDPGGHSRGYSDCSPLPGYFSAQPGSRCFVAQKHQSLSLSFKTPSGMEMFFSGDADPCLIRMIKCHFTFIKTEKVRNLRYFSFKAVGVQTGCGHTI